MNKTDKPLNVKKDNFIKVRFEYKQRDSDKVLIKIMNFKGLNSFKSFFNKVYKPYFYDLIKYEIVFTKLQHKLDL